MLGRFLGRDTWRGAASAPQSANQYVYGLNNPLAYTDPTGHLPNAVNAVNTWVSSELTPWLNANGPEITAVAALRNAWAGGAEALYANGAYRAGSTTTACGIPSPRR